MRDPDWEDTDDEIFTGKPKRHLWPDVLLVVVLIITIVVML
jgi:hypothetical protein